MVNNKTVEEEEGLNLVLWAPTLAFGPEQFQLRIIICYPTQQYIYT